MNRSMDGCHFILFLIFIRSNDLRGVENEKEKRTFVTVFVCVNVCLSVVADLVTR